MKTVYLAWVFHGNMSYDRYTKHTIRRQFPLAYQVMIDEFMQYPELKGHVELSGLSVETLRLWAPDTIAQLRQLADRGQITFCASYFAASVNACMDGNSHMDALRLGTQIVAETCGPIDGLFAQEQSYTPQLPWAMKQLGVRWVSVPSPPETTQPFVLRGFDGSRVYGIPIARIPWRTLAQSIGEVPDNSLFLYVGDFEMYQRLAPALEMAHALAQEDVRLEITLVSDYLRRFPPTKEVFMETCRFPEPVEAPHFSRWCSDPQDIRVHAASMQAMNDLRDARILAGLVRHHWGYDANTAASLHELVPDARTSDIEQPSEFASVIEQHLADDRGAVSQLDVASFLLSWGTNSDARGWYPLHERRLEHTHALRQSSQWSRRCLQNALSYIGQRIPLQPSGIPVLLFNGAPARDAWCVFEVESPRSVLDSTGQPLLAETVWESQGCLVRARVSLPSYGYTVVYLTDERAPESRAWHVGTKVSGAHCSLEYADGQVQLQLVGQSCSISYRLPKIVRELSQAEGQVARELGDPGEPQVFVRDGMCPELMLHYELTFGMHLVQRYTLEDDMVRCKWTFDCSRPFLLGTKDYFRPDGLAVSLRTQPGQVFYDAGYAVVEHANREAGYLVALQFAGIQVSEGGMVAVSSTGAQSFWFDPAKGELRLGLGASTVGGPAKDPDTMTVNAGEGRITHFNTWDEELFFGTYQHEFCIFPFRGAWKQQPVARRALAVNTPVRRRQLATDKSAFGASSADGLPAEASFLQVNAQSVYVQSAEWDNARVRLLLNEMHSHAAEGTLQIGERHVAIDLQAGELKYIAT
jgi:hypothetical protein